jgi:hypothetical protein
MTISTIISTRKGEIFPPMNQMKKNLIVREDITFTSINSDKYRDRVNYRSKLYKGKEVNNNDSECLSSKSDFDDELPFEMKPWIS